MTLWLRKPNLQDGMPSRLTANNRVSVKSLPTGVSGLDAVLGGGLPQYSVTLIAGGPGTGKSRLSQELMFGLATPQRPALHIIVSVEPTLTAPRFEQQFSFADSRGASTTFYYANVTHAILEQGLGTVLDTLVDEVDRVRPGIVVVDSFQEMACAASAELPDGMGLQEFIEQLALHLTSSQITTLLVGDFEENELMGNPVFSVPDGLMWLYKGSDRKDALSQLEVVRMRDQAPLPGLHALQLTNDKLEVLPRSRSRGAGLDRKRSRKRLSTGVAAVDEMLGGGIPAGDSLLVTGPAGSGKSMLADQFIAAGLCRGEPAVSAVFGEDSPESLTHSSRNTRDRDLMLRTGLLEVVNLNPRERSVDGALLQVLAAIGRTGAERLVIDSLAGFDSALPSKYREDFSESLFGMVHALTDSGLTVFMTLEVAQSFIDVRFSSDIFSFLADNVIALRCVEIDGQLRKVIHVVKMHAGQNDALSVYDVTRNGLIVGRKPSR